MGDMSYNEIHALSSLSLAETVYLIGNASKVSIKKSEQLFLPLQDEIITGFKHNFVVPNEKISALDTSVKY